MMSENKKCYCEYCFEENLQNPYTDEIGGVFCSEEHSQKNKKEIEDYLLEQAQELYYEEKYGGEKWD